MRMPAESAAEGPIRENNGKRESRCVMRKIGTKMANITPTRELHHVHGQGKEEAQFSGNECPHGGIDPKLFAAIGNLFLPFMSSRNPDKEMRQKPVYGDDGNQTKKEEP